MLTWLRTLAASGSSLVCGSAVAAPNVPSVPEPGTLALLGLGLLVIGIAAKRRS
jgi:hypothetical protein